jgi:hypothetical protein
MTDQNDPAYVALDGALTAYLDGLHPEGRVDAIDALTHWVDRRLSFEKRLASLSPTQVAHMVRSAELREDQLAALAACKTDAERERRIEGYARACYFVRCAWADYLNGVVPRPPVGPSDGTIPVK